MALHIHLGTPSSLCDVEAPDMAEAIPSLKYHFRKYSLDNASHGTCVWTISRGS